MNTVRSPERCASWTSASVPRTRLVVSWSVQVGSAWRMSVFAALSSRIMVELKCDEL